MGKRETTRENLGANTDTNDLWQLYQDTPQGGLTGVQTEAYLTDATHNKGTVTHGFDTTETYVESFKGRSGSYAVGRLLKEFKEGLMNVDKMLIDELSDLFFLLW